MFRKEKGGIRIGRLTRKEMGGQGRVGAMEKPTNTEDFFKNHIKIYSSRSFLKYVHANGI